MKIRRIVSTDMRKAMRKVREELGPDAVILSNHRVEGGTEIVAAVDYDEREINAALAQTTSNVSAPAQPTPPPTPPAPLRPAAPAPGPSPVRERALATMREEIGELRALMESQVALLGWNRWSRKCPGRANLLRRLSAAGLGNDLCSALIDRLSEHDDLAGAWSQVKARLTGAIKVTDDDILSHGGVIAMVGATGVGKTTTVAKLAARYAMRHGNRNVALVSTDNYRIGAQEQLLSYGRILGVPVLTASDRDELRDVLDGTRNKGLVVIDTAGMSHRDMRLTEQFATLRCEGDLIRSYLVMSANTQASGLNDIVRAFSKVSLNGCIVTKEDEAASLGGALTAIARHKLPVAYVSNGQRVPEDLQPARADDLVNKTLNLSTQAETQVDDEAMALRFGDVAAQRGL